MSLINICFMSQVPQIELPGLVFIDSNFKCLILFLFFDGIFHIMFPEPSCSRLKSDCSFCLVFNATKVSESLPPPKKKVFNYISRRGKKYFVLLLHNQIILNPRRCI